MGNTSAPGRSSSRHEVASTREMFVVAMPAVASTLARSVVGMSCGSGSIDTRSIRRGCASRRAADRIRTRANTLLEMAGPCIPPATQGPRTPPARAARRIMTDDGFNIGVLYAGNRAPYPLGPRAAKRSLAEIEAEFEL